MPLRVSLFVAGAVLGEVAVSLLVAGAAFGEVAVSFFVVGQKSTYSIRRGMGLTLQRNRDPVVSQRPE